jgi:hypothetical protein
MKRWAVYINGRFVGYVDARDEQEARNVAIVQFNPDAEDEISVMES